MDALVREADDGGDVAVGQAQSGEAKYGGSSGDRSFVYGLIGGLALPSGRGDLIGGALHRQGHVDLVERHVEPRRNNLAVVQMGFAKGGCSGVGSVRRGHLDVPAAFLGPGDSLVRVHRFSHAFPRLGSS